MVVDDEYWINGAMAIVCPSLTIEALIEVIAFMAISISSVPGLRSFGQVCYSPYPRASIVLLPFDLKPIL